MRIVQIVEDLRVGGLERMAVDLAIAHRAAGHDSRIYCLQERGDLAEEAEAAGIPVTAFFKKPGFSPQIVLALAEHLMQDRPHVLHGHNSGVHHYAALSAKLAGVPVVVNTRHGVSMSNGKPFDDRWFRRVWPITSGVAYVSAHSQRHYESEQILPADKGTVILNGIRLDAYRERYASPDPKRLVMGTVGRLVPVKGHVHLIDAFAQVAPDLPHATLRIIGYGPLEEELRKQIDHHGLTDRVTLLGPRSDIAEQLAQLDLFVFSSLSEGLPMTTLEALAAGLPIVSTRVGGIPEVAPAPDFAWFAEPADPTGLAERILQASQADLAAMGRRARERAFALYSVEAMQQNYERWYRSLLA